MHSRVGAPTYTQDGDENRSPHPAEGSRVHLSTPDLRIRLLRFAGVLSLYLVDLLLALRIFDLFVSERFRPTPSQPPLCFAPMVRTMLFLAMMIATVGSSWFLAACGNTLTSTEATGSTTSAQSAVLETAPNTVGDARPLQTVDDFRKAAETVGETLEPCSHSDVYLMCISMTQVAEPMLAAISQAAASMGWTNVVSTVIDIQNAGLRYKRCGTTLHGQHAATPSFSELSECLDATTILSSAKVRIEIAIAKDS